MSNKEQLLTLVRKRYAETFASSYRLAELYSRMETHAAKEESRKYKQVLDQAGAELAADERATQEDARQSEPLSLSIDEFSNEEQEEITVLLQTGLVLVRRSREKFDQVQQAGKTGSDEEDQDVVVGIGPTLDFGTRQSRTRNNGTIGRDRAIGDCAPARPLSAGAAILDVARKLVHKLVHTLMRNRRTQ
jgi:hypothetical protein